jgi:hypothetical protein
VMWSTVISVQGMQQLSKGTCALSLDYTPAFQLGN